MGLIEKKFHVLESNTPVLGEFCFVCGIFLVNHKVFKNQP